jgi:BirA family transcriptional regulator, biotin operon repressor / biotin---[acetyl-CoA-carboxylase] ligase
MATPALVRRTQTHLSTRRLGHPLRGTSQVDSTNRALRDWAAEGAPEGSTFLTEYQEAGRGRLGRQWAAAPGVNLMVSVLLRPADNTHLTLLPLVVALGVSDALRATCGPTAGHLKWPNDLRCGAAKVGGVLLETAPGSGPVPAIIAGIGLNVNQQAFPPALQEKATSLLLHSGQRTDRADLLAQILAAMEARYAQWERGAMGALRETVEGRMVHQGETVTLHPTTRSAPITGRVLGLSPAGGLRLATATGEQVVFAGDVSSQPTLS